MRRVLRRLDAGLRILLSADFCSCPCSQPRLALLSARNNALTRLPPEVGDCPLLASVLVRGNAIKDIPFELCTLKKLKDLELEENPLDDNKIKKMMQKPASFVKEVRAVSE